MTFIAQAQENCDDFAEGSDRRILCLSNQTRSGSSRGSQQIQASSNARGCLSFLGSTPAPVVPGTPAVAGTPGVPANGTTPAVAATPGTAAVEARAVGRRQATVGDLFEAIGSKRAALVAPAVPSTEFVIDAPSAVRAEKCRAAQVAAAGAGSSALDEAFSSPTMDGRIRCVKVAGYTADYDSCQRTSSMYDKVKMMEAGLVIVQAAQAQLNQQNVQNETTQRVAAGDAQNAAYDAQISATRKASQLNQQKAVAYAAAVAALGSQLQGWIKESNLETALCSGNTTKLGGDTIVDPAQVGPDVRLRNYANAAAVSAPQKCVDSIHLTYNSFRGEMIANRDAKGKFTAALMEFIAKGVQAGIAANQLGNIAKKVEEAKNSTEDPYNPATFDVCQVNMADPRCAQVGTRTNGSGLQDGGFSFGEGFGNNAFTPVGDAEDMTPVDPLALPTDQVAETTNPFVDDAKKASGILDPAGAASVQPGGAAGGGGGGGAGSPGGGSASLGNDTPGMDDSKKENDIKANKADGKYGQFAGGGFQAIKPMKDENPFANLFDGKGGGTLEEDRSIASGDIDGRDSGIFAKISKRYGQVQADKRIEAKNLEE